MIETKVRNTITATADLITEMFSEVARRFDETIPSRPDPADPNDDEEFNLVGMRHIVRHYEHLLAWIVDEPEQVSLEHYEEAELRDLILYAVRTGRTEALDLLIERTGFDVTAPDGQGLTLLDHAQRDKQYEVVHYLINRGVGHDRELLPSRTEEA